MRTAAHAIAVCLLALTALVGATSAEAQTITHIYLAPDGSDAGDGTRDDPFATLRQANAHLEVLQPTTPVSVHLQPGTYLETGTRWTYVPVRALTIGADHGVATFSGQNAFADYVLKINPAANRASINLRMSNLRFTAATNGLQLKSLQNAELSNLRFDHLGTRFSPTGTGYAALSIQNVSQVTVNSPTFSNLVNSPDQLALIHAIYAANDADQVTVNDPDISRVSGDPLRFRNGSDSFHIHGGTIRNAGEFTAFSEWFDQTRDETRSLDARLIDVPVSTRGYDSPLEIGRTACFRRFTLEPVDPCYITDQ